MKNCMLALVAVLSLTVLGLTGCGGSGETEVIDPGMDERSGVTEAEVNAYQEAMQNQGNQGPGN